MIKGNINMFIPFSGDSNALATKFVSKFEIERRDGIFSNINDYRSY